MTYDEKFVNLARRKAMAESVTPPGGAPLPDFQKAREALESAAEFLQFRDRSLDDWRPFDVLRTALDAAELALASQQQENERLREERARWAEAVQASVAAYRAWDAACDAPGKPDALTARFALQEATARLTEVEQAMLAGLSPRGEHNG
jgi:hypothetical protein